MSLDPYKQRVSDVFTTTNKNIVVLADAGSGKTFLITYLVNSLPRSKKVFVTAFADAIVKEIKKGLPEHVDSSTVHSKGLKLLNSNSGCRFSIDQKGGKYFKLALKILDLSDICLTTKEVQSIKKKGGSIEGELNKKKLSFVGKVVKVLDLCMQNLIDKNDISRIRSVGERYGYTMDFNSAECVSELLNHILTQKIPVSGTFEITFTDMLYLAYHFVDPLLFPKYDYIFVDETQDINPLQRELILRMRKDKTRTVMVGDAKQAIFGFLGANLDSLEELKNLPNTEVLPLSLTYRLSKAVAEEANKVFADDPTFTPMETLPTAKVGSVGVGYTSDAKTGEAIICRNNLPLIETFIDLSLTNKRAKILGKDLGEELKSMLSYCDNLSDLDSILSSLYDKLKSKGVENPRGTEEYAQKVEKVDILKKIHNFTGSFAKTNSLIDKMFSYNEDSNHINLMTCHASKGLEFENVYLLQPELMPSKFAHTDFAKYQEKCLKFVAITRAKNNLYYCNE